MTADHPPGCTCRKCLTGLGKWNLHSPEARRRSKRKMLKRTTSRETRTTDRDQT